MSPVPKRNSPRHPKAWQATVASVRAKYPSLWGRLDLPIEEIIFFILERYIDEHSKAELVRLDGRISHTTRALAAMEVGDVITLGPQAPQTARARMRTARLLMGVEDARWTLRTFPGGHTAERLPNGAGPRRVPVFSGITQELISAEIGVPFASKCAKRPADVGTNHRAVARKVLQDSQAIWTTRKASNGRLMITRTK